MNRAEEDVGRRLEDSWQTLRKQERKTFNCGMEIPDWWMLMRDVASAAPESTPRMGLAAIRSVNFENTLGLKPRSRSKMEATLMRRGARNNKVFYYFPVSFVNTRRRNRPVELGSLESVFCSNFDRERSTKEEGGRKKIQQEIG